jgi:DNA recombination protein RmuC
LRRVVESAGLTRYVDFDLQASVTSDAGGRPDMIVRLPGGMSLAVDAKVPLDAYLEASAIAITATGEEATGARAAPTSRQGGPRPCRRPRQEVVLVGTGLEPRVRRVLPAERGVARDRTRGGSDAARSRVPPARGARVSREPLGRAEDGGLHLDPAGGLTEARRLFELGTELYQRLGGLAGHAEDLRRAIERTVDTYNRFTGSLESRVLVTARKFPGIDETKLDAAAAPRRSRRHRESSSPRN